MTANVPQPPPPARAPGSGDGVQRASDRQSLNRPPEPRPQPAQPARPVATGGDSPMAAARAQAGGNGGKKTGFSMPKFGNPFAGKFSGLQGKIPAQYLAIAGLVVVLLIIIAVFGAVAPAVTESGQASEGAWFAMPENVESGPLFRAPKNLRDLIEDPSWTWIVWPLPWLLLYVLLRQDRFASKERTDVTLVNYGIGLLAIGFILPTPIAFIVDFAAKALGYAIPMSLPTLAGVVTLICVFVHITFQTGASVSGQRDWSPLAIAGLFLTGAVMIWFYPEAAFLSMIGWALIVAGIALMVVEVGRSGQRGNVLSVAVVMPVLFLAALGLFWYLIGLIALVVPPFGWSAIAVNSLRVVLRVIFALRPLAAVLIALAVANSGGEMLAAVLVREIYRRVVTNQSGDTPIQTMNEEGTARFDARAIGIMMLYLMVPIILRLIPFFI